MEIYSTNETNIEIFIRDAVLPMLKLKDEPKFQMHITYHSNDFLLFDQHSSWSLICVW